MTATAVSFRWLDLLEKEFDIAVVNLDLLLGSADGYIEENDWHDQSRSYLENISSCFVQLAHKALTIFQTSAKLEAELIHLRHELAEAEAYRHVAETENRQLLMKLHSLQLQLHSVSGSPDKEDSDKIRAKLEVKLEEERANLMTFHTPSQELALVRKENESLRKHIVALQAELCGAKLASKYLDKELAGRIQQIQLLNRELKGEEHDKLWKQLEAEIHLHRHKTVVRACRSRLLYSMGENAKRDDDHVVPVLSQPPDRFAHRTVSINKPPDQGLGMAITGGREHGVPIMISMIHPDTPAAQCGQLFIGDALLAVNGHSLKEATHASAVEVLSSQEGQIVLEVIFVPPDDDDEDCSHIGQQYPFKYKIFDEEVLSVGSSVQYIPNGRLSRASIDSIRGSSDNILMDSPRKSALNALPDGTGEPDSTGSCGSINERTLPSGSDVQEEEGQQVLDRKHSDVDSNQIMCRETKKAQRVTDSTAAPEATCVSSLEILTKAREQPE